ncbi:MAG TPA: hypothetical protein VH107_12270 [Lacipirellulaceae bacterium]|nr:hypothetical protein [Lacipirellulaceae bacterium]
MGNFTNDSEDDLPLVGDSKLDRAHELTWSLLDEQITDAEMSELENLLRTDKKALESYVRCMQLHADLASHFEPAGKKSRGSDANSTPVLGFLNLNTPLTGVDSPTTEGTH